MISVNYLYRIQRDLEGASGMTLDQIDADDANFIEPAKPNVEPTGEIKPLVIKEAPIVTEIPPVKEVKAPEIEPVASPATPDTNDDEGLEAEEFFLEVNKLRGDEIIVEYGEIDPLSPEGVVLRDAAIEEAALLKFEKFMETNYPEQYAYLLHAQAGLPKETFFQKAENLEVLPTTNDILASVEAQKAILIKDSIAKGNSEKVAKLIVNSAIEDEELEEKALEALANQEKIKQGKINAIKAEGDLATKQRQDALKEMEEFVLDVVGEGKVGKLVIPQADRLPFATAFKKNIRYDNGKFLYVTELSNENIQDVFEKEYFSHKKGNLSALVSSAAKTENAKRLRRTFKATGVPNSSAAAAASSMTLGNLEAE